MSTVNYVTEPPTSGKVVINTTFGPLDIELWCKEAPKATRNFIQLCMEGYYNDNPFHRVVKNYLVQTGDPTGVKMSAKLTWQEPVLEGNQFTGTLFLMSIILVCVSLIVGLLLAHLSKKIKMGANFSSCWMLPQNLTKSILSLEK